jgi:hypothetical protein
MMFRAVFWVILLCKMIVSEVMMEAVHTSETSVDNHFTRQYNPEDSSEHNITSLHIVIFRQNDGRKHEDHATNHIVSIFLNREVCEYFHDEDHVCIYPHML